MKWPKLETIVKWKESGRMRRTDDLFWAGDKKQYDFWLSCVVTRLEKENAKKEKTETTES